MSLKPPYKDKMGRWRTQSLFKEYAHQSPSYAPIFTLKEFDDGEYKSFPKLFITFNDPTGYQFAKSVLGSYEHWMRLTSQKWFRSHLDGWLEELEVKLASEGLMKIKRIADGGDQQALAASKFLVNKGWEASKGRPKKADILRAARIQGGIEAAVEEDMGRLKLVPKQ